MSSTDEKLSRDVAEASREKEWKGRTFLRDLFLGNFRLEHVHPFPGDGGERPEFRRFYDRLERFLREEVDPAEIDATGEYPPHVVEGLRSLGAFGLKIPRSYGGLGFTHAEYVRVMRLLGSTCGNVTALLSAHQAIGVPQPILLFGTEDQKRAFLPRCAKGAISAFALTEPAVGSDPARLATTAELSPDGRHWILNGDKLWTTNGTLAELLVVMARNPANDRVNAFVVETEWPGVEVAHRCRFMGLRALANAYLRFRDVKIPRENLIGEEGDGLKIALVTLNTGRLSLPAATTGTMKRTLEIARTWAEARVQWGVPIGRHEAIAHKIADLTADTFAMESVAELLGALADRPDYDIRLEAAAAKEWNTSRQWQGADELLQIRGGRGYETEASLEARGEVPIGVERILRDSRINRIFEGSSEIMHLFMAREAVDRHLSVAGPWGDPDAGWGARLRVLPRMAAFYAWWYPSRWLGFSVWPRYRAFGPLAGHVRFLERSSRRLARSVFHGMLVHQASLQRRQGFLFRLVDVAMELFAATAAISRAQRMRTEGHPEADGAVGIADTFARGARRRVRRLFRELWRNDDARRAALGRAVLEGRHRWLESGTVGVSLDPEALRPRTVPEILEAEGRGPGRPGGETPRRSRRARRPAS